MANRNLEAFCGLYCGACPVFLNRADDWIVKVVLEQHGLAFEDLHCEGCRTDTLSPSCRDCDTRDCAKNKGLDSCSGCDELPCERISGFRTLRPHGGEVIGNLKAIKDHGSETWLTDQAAQWQCASCGRVGSWYEQACGECGTHLPAGYEA
jgi:hypothetical protein